MTHHFISRISFIVALAAMICNMVFVAPIDKRSISSCYKSAKLTQYWIPKEGDADMSNNGQSVTLDGSKSKTLQTKDGITIAKVSETTYDKFQMEGTGLLQSGKMVNLGESTSVFMELDRSSTPYGIGHTGEGLNPWVSVASNDIATGTTLYVKEMDGLVLPGGKTHNGCVRVDDQGWGLGNCHIDFFVLQFSAYQELVKELPSTVTVTETSCTIKDYVTTGVKKWAVL
ncbi:uncharacterized protein ATC70_005619 [Mucor velutinosus]|uniref:3D domain-containing protein n=1 Tax=Mucor velutinosus TaxID=708070 RepID=A0AAN7DFQ4_9FUNG|nr:hypothetical protein ATC70_005619 [Mucor velutinosus]